MVQLSLINTSYRGNIIAVLFVLELHFRNCTADIAVERQKGSHEQSPEEAPGICPWKTARPSCPPAATKDDLKRKRADSAALLDKRQQRLTHRGRRGRLLPFQFRCEAERSRGVYRNRAPLHFRRFNCDGDVKRLRVEIWPGDRICGSGFSPAVFRWPESLQCQAPPVPPKRLGFYEHQ